MAKSKKEKVLTYLREHPGEWISVKDINFKFNLGNRQCAEFVLNEKDIERKKISIDRGYRSMSLYRAIPEGE